MDAHAWYSLVQYQPQLDSDEGINVGLLMFSFAPRYLRLQMAPHNKRVSKVLGKSGFDSRRLDLAKQMLERRVLTEAREAATKEEVQRILLREGNQLVFPVLHQTHSDALDETFDELFAQLVDVRAKRPARHARRIPEFREFVDSLPLTLPVQRDVEFTLDLLERKFKAPLVYQNGVTNFVMDEVFGNDPIAKAGTLGTRGLVLKSQYPESAPARLVVVSQFDDDALAQRVRDILAVHEVEYVDVDDLGAFGDRILREAH